MMSPQVGVSWLTRNLEKKKNRKQGSELVERAREGAFDRAIGPGPPPFSHC